MPITHLSSPVLPEPISPLRAVLQRLSAHAERRRPLAPQVMPPERFTLCEHDGTGRVATERFISDCFLTCFGSNINAFMPRLFSVEDERGTTWGAFGLRSATQRLFLEQYLDEPVEAQLSRVAGTRVERSTVVEVGHFSGIYPGALRAMIELLIAHLHREGHEWVVFTGTVDLRNAFGRLGLTPVDLGAASIDRLPPSQRDAWGSYYAHSPRVLAGRIRDGLVRIAPEVGA